MYNAFLVEVAHSWQRGKTVQHGSMVVRGNKWNYKNIKFFVWVGKRSTIVDHHMTKGMLPSAISDAQRRLHSMFSCSLYCCMCL